MKALDVCSQSEVKARINGVQSKMKDFDFLFGLLLGERILKHIDNLSKTLQATAMSAVEAHRVAKLCIDVFKKFEQMVILTCFGNLQKPRKIRSKLQIQLYLMHANVLGIMKMVVLNLITLLMSNNITSKYIFRVLI